jgi:hypothetical protein
MNYGVRRKMKDEVDARKIVCCYHLRDFDKLTETHDQALYDHYFKINLNRAEYIPASTMKKH